MCLQFGKNIDPLWHFTKGRFPYNDGWVNSLFLGTCLCPMKVCGFFHSNVKSFGTLVGRHIYIYAV